MGYELSLRKCLSSQFWVLVKVYFLLLKLVGCMIHGIAIPIPITESKSKVHKCQNDFQGFPIKKTSLTVIFIKHESTKMIE
jgi:hypothetical protein